MTLSYEMCVKLKEAGFPQVFVQNNPKGSATIETYGPYDPTLEELIEACGDGFSFLSRDELLWQAVAYAYGKVPRIQSLGKGSTRSEAVAALWFSLQALNKQ